MSQRLRCGIDHPAIRHNGGEGFGSEMPQKFFILANYIRKYLRLTVFDKFTSINTL
jgi:hypothetical protein